MNLDLAHLFVIQPDELKVIFLFESQLHRKYQQRKKRVESKHKNKREWSMELITAEI